MANDCDTRQTLPRERLFLLSSLDRITPGELEAALAALPQWRRDKALRFRHAQGRKECAFAYLLLCRALRQVYGIDEQPRFQVGEHGKPTLVGHPGVHFNLSHCRKAIACVVADQPVGVDVEQLGRYNEPLARRVLCQPELEAVLRAPDPQLPFTRLWTQKEAVVKLTGRGIDDDLPNLLAKYNNVSLHTDEHLDQGFVVTVAHY